MDGTEEDKMKKKSFYKNGNIGLIVDENGINLKKWKASPICLPTIAVYNHRSIWSKIRNFRTEVEEEGIDIALH